MAIATPAITSAAEISRTLNTSGASGLSRSNENTWTPNTNAWYRSSAAPAVSKCTHPNDNGKVTAAASTQPQARHQCAAQRKGDRFSMKRCATMFTAKSAMRRVRFCATREGAKNKRQPRRQ